MRVLDDVGDQIGSIVAKLRDTEKGNLADGAKKCTTIIPSGGMTRGIAVGGGEI
jgi:hypothetical protein